MTDISATSLSCRVDGSTLVENADLTLAQGEFVAILGPNGAGKTTLLRALLGLMTPDAGLATIDGADATTLSPHDRARKVTYLPQRRPLAWPNNVRDIVSLGRFSHGAALGKLSQKDAHAVDKALQLCDLQELSSRNITTLSGGELARVHFARAIAAETPLLIADEPVASLDPFHQIRIAELIRSFVDSGGGALVVLHEISLAARYADRIIWMSGGKIVASGSPDETINSTLLRDIYGIDAHTGHDEHGVDIRIKGIG